MSNVKIHPQVDGGLKPAAANFAGGTLWCGCSQNRVQVTIGTQAAHNHVCGCTKCWKPKGSLFSQVAVVPRDKLSVEANGHKLAIVDPKATIQRYACKECGVHMYGRIENKVTLPRPDFFHTELREQAGSRRSSRPSSRRQSGADPANMGAVRGRPKGQAARMTACRRR
jgi:S-(hydroxymethyl)glutathione synthase